MRREGRIWHAACALGLTYQQTELVVLLAAQGGRFISKHDLADAMAPATRMGRDPVNAPKLVRVLVSKLRKQFGAKAIETKHGMGYRLAPSVCHHVNDILEGYSEAA